MDLDAALLARLQFAFTIMFHYLFSPLTIGLGAVMVALEGLYLKTKDEHYASAARFWTGIFALHFALGVASGIVMEFQFGTNWSTYSRFVGDVFGSALAAEGVLAFFLESAFLALLVFGWDRLSPRLHFFSTCMVFLGAVLASVWITVANSWQQTPAGHHYTGGRAEMLSFWAVVFNPSTVHRLVHTWLGALVMGAFFVLGICAWYALKGRHGEFTRRCFGPALAVAALASLALPFSGHLQARNVARCQPAKMAALEGHFETGAGGAPLYLIGWPDEAAGQVRLGVSVPGGLSFLVHSDFTRPVPGLDQFRREEWPSVWLSFQSYHIMVGLGLYFIAVTLAAAYFHWRGTLPAKRWLLWALILGVAGAFIANELGWVAAEVGRQPWVVYPEYTPPSATQPFWEARGGLRTDAAVSPTVPAAQVAVSLALFVAVYLFLAGIWLYLLRKKIAKGPQRQLGMGKQEQQLGMRN